jgi:peptidoglycan/LPS O-acetylase OafA/YrhL
MFETTPRLSARELFQPQERLSRLPMLDGWRGISILVVLGAHMLPLGPKRLGLNEAAGVLGMSLFFALSGFLITSTLIHDASVRNFVIRRLCRIVPLAWFYSLIVLPLAGASSGYYLATLLFYANIPPYWLLGLTGHLWSVCVEMQFYLFIAILFALSGRKGLVMLAPLCLAITAERIAHHTLVAIFTLYRVDEILAGACLALAYAGMLGGSIRGFLSRVNPWIVGGLLLVACHPRSGPVNYLRPYLAAGLVGATIFQREGQLTWWLQASGLAYIADISYALYVIHPLTQYGWLGSGSKLAKYSKRPLSFALSFGLAHLSTRYYESRWIAWGKRRTFRNRAYGHSPSSAVSDLA